jgi:hypothetical protein
MTFDFFIQSVSYALNAPYTGSDSKVGESQITLAIIPDFFYNIDFSFDLLSFTLM